MTDVALHRSYAKRFRTCASIGFSDGGHFNRIAYWRPRSMRLNIGDRFGLQICTRQCFANQLRLRLTVGDSEAGTSTILIGARS